MTGDAPADAAPGDAPAPAAGDPERFPQRAIYERELVVGVFLVLLAKAAQGLVGPDLAGHTVYGLAHLFTGELAHVDPYSYAIQGLPWTNHEWLFELLIAWTFHHAGEVGMVLLQATVWSTTTGLLLWQVWRRVHELVPTILIMLFVVMLCLPAISVRPQMFTFLCFTSVALLLEEGRRGRPWGWLGAGLVFLPWVNLHGGFLAGLGVFGVYGVGLVLDLVLRRATQPDGAAPTRAAVGWGLAGGLLGTAVTLVNPSGIHLYDFLTHSLGRPRPMITEWAPTQLDVPGVLYVGLIAFTGVALWRARSRVPLAHALVLGVTAWMGLKHLRHQPFFVIAVAVFVAHELGTTYRGWVPGPQEDLSESRRVWLQRVTRVVLGVLVVAMVVNPRHDFLRLRLRPDGRAPAPTGAFAFMEAHGLRGNLYVSFDWAQLVIGRYHDRFQVFFDGRFRTVYPEQVERDYQTLQYSLEGRERALEAYPTELVLLTAEIPEAVRRMREEPGWVELYHDSVSALFARRDGPWAGIAPEEGPDPLPILRFELAPITSGVATSGR